MLPLEVPGIVEGKNTKHAYIFLSAQIISPCLLQAVGEINFSLLGGLNEIEIYYSRGWLVN